MMDALVCKRPGVWVISACSLTRMGSAALLAESGYAPGEIVLLSGHEYRSDVLEVLCQVPPGRIIFYLSPSLSDLLMQIKLLGWLMNACSGPSVLLLCRTTQVWIFDTLRKIAGDMARNNRILVMSARVPVSTLRATLKERGTRWGNHPYARPLPAAGICGLSLRELQSLEMTLNGISISAQSCLTGLSTKTLYSHRTRAIRKLSFQGNRRGAYRLWQLFVLADMNVIHHGNL